MSQKSVVIGIADRAIRLSSPDRRPAIEKAKKCLIENNFLENLIKIFENYNTISSIIII